MSATREPTEYVLWLESLKPGDTFAIANGGYGHTKYSIHTVQRTTATQIVCADPYARRYSRSTGRGIGSDSYSRVEKATPHIVAAIQRGKLLFWLSDLAHTNRIKGLDTDVLQAMKTAYDRASKPPENSDVLQAEFEAAYTKRFPISSGRGEQFKFDETNEYANPATFIAFEMWKTERQPAQQKPTQLPNS